MASGLPGSRPRRTFTYHSFLSKPRAASIRAACMHSSNLLHCVRGRYLLFLRLSCHFSRERATRTSLLVRPSYFLFTPLVQSVNSPHPNSMSFSLSIHLPFNVVLSSFLSFMSTQTPFCRHPQSYRVVSCHVVSFRLFISVGYALVAIFINVHRDIRICSGSTSMCASGHTLQHYGHRDEGGGGGGGGTGAGLGERKTKEGGGRAASIEVT